LFLPGYSPGDPRADLLWRLAVMAAFDAFYVAVATSALLWLLADRRGEKKPPRPDEKKGGRSQA
jgi:hypothetical protein